MSQILVPLSFFLFLTVCGLAGLFVVYRLKLKTLEIQRIEAERKLLEVQGMQGIPDYIDRGDAEAVRAWRSAKRELDDKVAQGSAHAASRERDL